MLIDPVALKSDLQNQVLEVVFKKADGSVRKMRATLSPKYLPAPGESVQSDSEQQLLTEEKQAIAVWDIDVKGWRSFRTDRVISVQSLNTV